MALMLCLVERRENWKERKNREERKSEGKKINIFLSFLFGKWKERNFILSLLFVILIKI